MPSSVSSPSAAERQDEGVAGQSTSAAKWAPWLLSLCQAGWVPLVHTDACEAGTRGRLVSPCIALARGTLGNHFLAQDPSTQNAPDCIGVSDEKLLSGKANL